MNISYSSSTLKPSGYFLQCNYSKGSEVVFYSFSEAQMKANTGNETDIAVWRMKTTPSIFKTA